MPTKPKTVRVVCPCNECKGSGLTLQGYGNERDNHECPECHGDGGEEFDAILIPLATGPVVVEKGAMELSRERLSLLAYEIVECGGGCTDGDVTRILAPLFPAGIAVADVSVTVALPSVKLNLWLTGDLRVREGDTIHIERKEEGP